MTRANNIDKTLTQWPVSSNGDHIQGQPRNYPKTDPSNSDAPFEGSAKSEGILHRLEATKINTVIELTTGTKSQFPEWTEKKEDRIALRETTHPEYSESHFQREGEVPK